MLRGLSEWRTSEKRELGVCVHYEWPNPLLAIFGQPNQQRILLVKFLVEGRLNKTDGQGAGFLDAQEGAVTFDSHPKVGLGCLVVETLFDRLRMGYPNYSRSRRNPYSYFVHIFSLGCSKKFGNRPAEPLAFL